jgi:hypothetical protein
LCPPWRERAGIPPDGTRRTSADIGRDYYNSVTQVLKFGATGAENED